MGKEILIIHGREDKVIPMQNTYKLFSLIPNAQFHVFGEHEHRAQIEQASRFNYLVKQVLSESDA